MTTVHRICGLHIVAQGHKSLHDHFPWGHIMSFILSQWSRELSTSPWIHLQQFYANPDELHTCLPLKYLKHQSTSGWAFIMPHSTRLFKIGMSCNHICVLKTQLLLQQDTNAIQCNPQPNFIWWSHWQHALGTMLRGFCRVCRSLNGVRWGKSLGWNAKNEVSKRYI